MRAFGPGPRVAVPLEPAEITHALRRATVDAGLAAEIPKRAGVKIST